MKRTILAISAILILASANGCALAPNGNCDSAGCDSLVGGHRGYSGHHAGRGSASSSSRRNVSHGHASHKQSCNCQTCSNGRRGHNCPNCGGRMASGDSVLGGMCPHCGPIARAKGMVGGMLGQGGAYDNGQGFAGPAGPATAAYAYPYYTLRAPRDFLMDNPPSIGR